jgi:hypothetical protein
MSRARYRTGDTVNLKTDAFNRKGSGLSCRIVAVLPGTEALGVAQYHVQFGHESCTRRITENDIDLDASVSARPVEVETSRHQTSAWINPRALKVKK